MVNAPYYVDKRSESGERTGKDVPLLECRVMEETGIFHECTIRDPLVDGDIAQSPGGRSLRRGIAVGISPERRSVIPGPSEARGEVLPPRI